jgi:acyl transferase domain-containing protein
MSAPSADHRELLAQAVRQVRAARARLEEVERARHEPLAVLGAGVRLPGGVEDLDGFWELLRDGRDAVSAHLISPDGRRRPSGEPPIDGRWAGQLSNVDRYDAEFFGLRSLEAAHVDPQQRLVLEVAWEAIEDAGLPLERLQAANTGVFLGLYGTDYLALQLTAPETINAYTGPGGALSIAANRLSYLLDLHGPSMSVDTACSSSLVAVHLACRALRQGDCDLALVGGVNVIVSPLSTQVAEKVLPLSPTGRCRTFDAGADGIVRAEGCAMLLLARSSDASSGRGRIRGLIRGTAVNQDGRSNGLTAPNPRAQSELHRGALADAAADPAEIVYLEAHGTGTPLGDPIEVHALSEVYGHGAVPCALGSVKANLGHLEAAAGIVGLVKAMLVLEHGYAPPNLHLRQLNPEIDFEGTRLHLPTELTALPPATQPWLAAVSSFGFGGANAHAVLEAPPAIRETDRVPAHAADGYLLPVSARSEGALRELVARYGDCVEGADADVAAELCAAAALQRTHHPYRAGFSAGRPEDLATALRAAASSASLDRRPLPGPQPRVAFVFSGQGSQWTGMGRELMEREPVVREEVAICDAIVRDLAGWSLAEQLMALDGESRLHETEVAQVAIGALQLGLAALWRSWGIEPDAVTGHSMGEIVAACVAGALERAPALELLLLRGRIAERATRGGAMASIGLPVADVERLLGAGGADGIGTAAGGIGTAAGGIGTAAGGIGTVAGRVGIAAVNGPRSTVVSGDPAAVELLENAATVAGARTQRLLVEYGFHSPLLDGCDGELAAAVAHLRPRDGAVTLYSTVTGGRLDARELDGAHWGRNLRDRVLLRPTIDALAGDGISTFIEIGPHPVLLRDIEETLREASAGHLAVASIRRDRPVRLALGGSLAELYRAGADIRWDAVLAPPRRHVSLPSYPWQRRRHWLATKPGNGRLAEAERDEPEAVAGFAHSERVVDHTRYVRERVSAAAGLEIEDVPEDLELEALGLTSLSIVELRNQVERELGIVVPLAALLGGGTPVDLALAIREAIELVALDSTAVAAGSQRGLG